MDEFYQKLLIGVVLMVIGGFVGNIKYQLKKFVDKQEKQQDQINDIEKDQATRNDVKEVHTRIDELGKTFDGKFDSMQKELITVIRENK